MDETETKKERVTDKQIQRQTNRCRDKQTNVETDRQRMSKHPSRKEDSEGANIKKRR